MANANKNTENNYAISENDTRAIKSKFDGITGLRELFINELKSLYYLEKSLLKAFPKMIKNSCSFELIEAITIHFEETKLQIIRLEDAFLVLNENPTLQRCEATECLLEDVDRYIDDTKFGIVRDAGIIVSLHKIEHYEIATYSILSTFAENINEPIISEMLDKSLNEEKVTELRLSKISNSIRFDVSESK